MAFYQRHKREKLVCFWPISLVVLLHILKLCCCWRTLNVCAMRAECLLVFGFGFRELMRRQRALHKPTSESQQTGRCFAQISVRFQRCLAGSFGRCERCCVFSYSTGQASVSVSVVVGVVVCVCVCVRLSVRLSGDDREEQNWAQVVSIEWPRRASSCVTRRVALACKRRTRRHTHRRTLIRSQTQKTGVGEFAAGAAQPAQVAL